ncbi:MAG TPA: ABC transporter ATP-binding protein [Marmoricola sp.]|nr:ABC transporter ATP-binding protein [Marmoricola sp.]
MSSIEQPEARPAAVPAAAPSTGAAPGTALSLSDVSLRLGRNAGDLALVEGVSFSIAPGERVAMVGESGSGKSVLARAVLGLDRDLVVSGEIKVGSKVVSGRGERGFRAVRGRRVAMVFQNPMGSLDPLMTVGAQVAETLRLGGASRATAEERATSLLSELGIADAARRARAYPHEFSGGMQQRVVLAMALAADPEVLIADEPTTALDVRAQEQVLTVLGDVTRDRGLTVLLITHDLSVVAGFAERVLVMYAGRLVHDDAVEDVFAAPAHPYTRGLLEAIPRMDRRPERLPTIAGTIPPPGARPSGCVFHPRCPHAMPVCSEVDPAPTPSPAGGRVSCHLFTQPEEDR